MAAQFPQIYLIVLSSTEVLDLVDSHMSITVPYQDAVCL